jgi:hypothetical protein
MAEIQEVSVSSLIDSERSNRLMLAVIAILGAALALVGWVRYFR